MYAGTSGTALKIFQIFSLRCPGKPSAIGRSGEYACQPELVAVHIDQTRPDQTFETRTGRQTYPDSPAECIMEPVEPRLWCAAKFLIHVTENARHGSGYQSQESLNVAVHEILTALTASASRQMF